jgi:hypothetical protein
VNQAFGGWQVNAIATLRSDLPTDALVGRLPQVLATVNRPDVVAGQSTLVANPGFDQYFNPAAFAIPGTVTNALGAPVRLFGNAGRSILRAPGSRNLDAPLFKDFSPSRTPACGISNGGIQPHEHADVHTTQCPKAPSFTVGNAAFGKLSGSQTVGRQVQFGLKLVW